MEKTSAKSDQSKELPQKPVLKSCHSESGLKIPSDIFVAKQIPKSLSEGNLLQNENDSEKIEPNPTQLDESLQILLKQSFDAYTEHNKSIFLREEFNHIHDELEAEVRC